jgi:hypothetical protein
MAKRNKRKEDAIYSIVGQLGLVGITQEELFREGGLARGIFLITDGLVNMNVSRSFNMNCQIEPLYI